MKKIAMSFLMNSKTGAVLLDLLIPLLLFYSLNNQLYSIAWLLFGLVILTRLLVTIKG